MNSSLEAAGLQPMRSVTFCGPGVLKRLWKQSNVPKIAYRHFLILLVKSYVG